MAMMSSSSSLLLLPTLLHLLLLLLINPTTPALAQGILKQCGFRSMYVFGDSLSDAGNAIMEFPNSYLGKFPNGMTIGRPTGRACDGYLIVDRIAQSAGLPPPNPFLNKSLNHSTGANLAVGGVGLLSKELRTDFHMKLDYSQSSLEIQLGWFEEFLKGDSGRQDDIGSSLFVLGGGGNDYATFSVNDSFFWKSPLRTKMLIMPYVIDSLRNGTKRVIGFGARNIVLMGVYQYQGGCLPGGNESMMHVPDIICSKRWNAYHRLHNQLVQELVEELKDEFPHIRIAYGDIWAGVDWIFHNYRSLGFEHSNYVRCCGNADQDCASPGSPFCPDPQHYIFWDGRHFTDHVYRLISEKMIPQLYTGLQCGEAAPSSPRSLAIYLLLLSFLCFFL